MTYSLKAVTDAIKRNNINRNEEVISELIYQVSSDSSQGNIDLPLIAVADDVAIAIDQKRGIIIAVDNIKLDTLGAINSSDFIKRIRDNHINPDNGVKIFSLSGEPVGPGAIPELTHNIGKALTSYNEDILYELPDIKKAALNGMRNEKDELLAGKTAFDESNLLPLVESFKKDKNSKDIERLAGATIDALNHSQRMRLKLDGLPYVELLQGVVVVVDPKHRIVFMSHHGNSSDGLIDTNLLGRSEAKHYTSGQDEPDPKRLDMAQARAIEAIIHYNEIAKEELDYIAGESAKGANVEKKGRLL